MPYAHANDIDLYYEIQGEGDPLLLIPGLGSDISTWSTFLPEIQSKFQAIAVENRGSARSSKPSDGYSTEQMAADLVALLDQLHIQTVHVVGKSMGGMIAQILAANHPARVRSMVLASTLLRHDQYTQELLELGRSMAEGSGLLATYRQAFLLSYSREYCIRNRSRLKEVEVVLKQVQEEDLLRGYLGQSLACEKHDSSALAPKIKVPTLVIVGKYDIITPPEGASELSAAIPGAQLVIFPKGGHGFWREFSSKVNPIVRDFLLQQHSNLTEYV
jgi:3-oxoadipate enol-lactonase